MSEQFQAVIVGDEQFRRAMGGIGRFSRRPRLAMRDMAAVLEEQTEDNLAAEGRPKWPELSERTVRARLGRSKAHTQNDKSRKPGRRASGDIKILQDSGLLAGSVHSQFGDDFTMIGAARPQARIQQLGGKAGRGLKVTIPARPYLPFTASFELQPEAEGALLRTAMEHLRRAAAQ
jgi:phage gpG-like protein